MASCVVAIASFGCGGGSGSDPDGPGKPGTGGSGGGDTGGGTGGGGGPCKPKTCESEGAECGWIADGCGAILICGQCADGQTCGFAAQNRCGACQPKSCEDLALDGHRACGQQLDGCNKPIDCGSCGEGQICGDGKRNLCIEAKDGGDLGVECKTRDQACAQAGIECGAASDGCGNLIECGSCTAPATCGGTGVHGKCGSVPACEPKTCAQLGYDCGMAVDNCGTVIDCGPMACGAGKICGGGGANRCGEGGGGHHGEACPGGDLTTVTGTVYTPAGANGDPVYGALVYIPSSLGDIPAFPTAATCDRCDTQVPPRAVAHAVTGPDGKFVLTDVPSGTQPLVIQIGRWRRKVDIDIQGCQENRLTAEQTRLAKRHHEANNYDNIPMIAVSTGDVDALECVIRKMGVDDREFTNPNGTGRIHFYKGKRKAGAQISSSTPGEAQLVASVNTLMGYDAVLLACQGGETTRDAADVARLVDYTNAGGRVFATHFSRDWLRYEQPFSSSANWTGINNGFTTATGRIDTSFQKGRDFAEWLRLVGAGTNAGGNTEISITEARQSISTVASAQRWIWLPNNSDHVQHMTFNTPMALPPAQQCGRVVFSDFHVANGSFNGQTFPRECGSGGLTAQEKVLLFMLLDLASCIQSEDPRCRPACRGPATRWASSAARPVTAAAGC
ncbi:Tryptophan synthase alpha chain [Vulgatibacter incomptus]|uniref:Tryptophan synthase alpha chain n=1 Tax=Vulgatibacter incomptus TaxID=1391653 RepID=A0A0K1PDB4_9BACT|nr:Tryptophan synthase alpha chain [Vulgatibacter incomptus]